MVVTSFTQWLVFQLASASLPFQCTCLGKNTDAFGLVMMLLRCCTWIPEAEFLLVKVVDVHDCQKFQNLLACCIPPGRLTGDDGP